MRSPDDVATFLAAHFAQALAERGVPGAASRGDEATGPVATLLAYDERHDAHLLETLEAWLDSFGDVASAAAATFVHPNTLRYRLRRLAEVSGLDLADPEQRFAAMLELRMLTRR